MYYMKIEQLIVQYLYLNKKVTLENIGTFRLLKEIDTQPNGEQPIVLPENSIEFEFNIKAPQEEGLIKYIVEQTRKFRPLAISDLESFSILGKQFLNLGKPLNIKDLGSIQKNQNDEYVFTQCLTIEGKADGSAATDQNKPSKLEEFKKIDFSSPAPIISKKKFIIPIIVIVMILCSLILLYSKFNKKEKSETAINQPIERIQQPQIVTPPIVAVETTKAPIVADTVKTPVQQVTQTLPPPPTPKDTVVKIPPTKPVVKPPTNFKVVIREYTDKESADKGLIALSRFEFGKNIQMYTKDSITYRLAVTVSGYLKDSSRIKDSVKVLFGKKTSIDLH